MIMKKFTLTMCFLALTTAFALAADYHLVQTPILDGSPPGKPWPVVYVLLMPSGTSPQVFQKFDSPQMEASLATLPRGSVVHYDAYSHSNEAPSSAQREALKIFCEKRGITYVESPVD